MIKIVKIDNIENDSSQGVPLIIKNNVSLGL